MNKKLDQANQLIRSKCRLTYASSKYIEDSFRFDPKIPFLKEQEKELYTIFYNTFKDGESFYNLKNSFIKFGWEFQVQFQENFVQKKPNGIFYEVNSVPYISNVKANYEKLKRFIGNQYVAQTEFNCSKLFIEQELGKDISYIKFSNTIAVKDLIEIVQSLIVLLDKEKWLPDIEISIDWFVERIYLRNFLMIKGKIKIHDFSYIYDPFRIHPEFTCIVVLDRIKTLKKIEKDLEVLTRLDLQ